jgi:hypothetical protein
MSDCYQFTDENSSVYYVEYTETTVRFAHALRR